MFKKLIIKVSKIVNKIDNSNTKIICSNTKNMILMINIIIVDFIDFFNFKNILMTLTQLIKTLTQNNYVNCVREFWILEKKFKILTISKMSIIVDFIDFFNINPFWSFYF